MQEAQIVPDSVICEWNDCLSSFGLRDAELLQQSSRSQRVYALDGRVFKLRLLHDAAGCSEDIRQPLQREFSLISRARGIRGVPVVLDLKESGQGFCISYTRIKGRPLATKDDKRPRIRGLALARILIRVAVILARLSLRRLAHNDVHTHNVYLQDTGAVYLLDYDCVTDERLFGAVYRNFFQVRKGREADGQPCYGSFLYLLAWSIRPFFPTRLSSHVVRFFGYEGREWP